jgi:hypothetical protein
MLYVQYVHLTKEEHVQKRQAHPLVREDVNSEPVIIRHGIVDTRQYCVGECCLNFRDLMKAVVKIVHS